MGKVVNKRELAEIVGKSQQTLTTWQKNGMPISSDGANGTANLYDTEEIIQWMISREIERRIADHGGDMGDWFDYEKERARLTHHQANIAGLDEEVKRGRLIPADVVESAWVDFVAAFRAKVLSIPTKAAHQFITLSDLNQIQDCLKEHLFEALAELADYDPEHYGIEPVAPCGADGSAAA
ncbi:terminase small subunit [Kistimonas scapharcae]|uniref:terminase small subunit n=1 Tax=Kistimonas scapharcae TaxID=1036133 RepID=UPI0031E7822D